MKSEPDRQLHFPKRRQTDTRIRPSQGQLYIGTSGWTYDDWRGRFYPREVTRTNWLRWYSARLHTTEINGSFYRTPSLEAVYAWRDQTPADFKFAWKASKFITHWKRLGASSANSIELMETRLAALGIKCGPVLFQLPERFQADREKLRAFIAMLPKRHTYAFEFRHASWYNDGIYDVLARNKISLCLSDHHHAPSPWVVTARHVYIRGHGPSGRYKGSYSDKTLRSWAQHIADWRSERRTVYVYFDNDQKSAAPNDAERLSSYFACDQGPDIRAANRARRKR